MGAIDHVEVLTDGAAAQYGTDAIAGVMNIILKKSGEGGQIVGTGGQDYDRQGLTGSWSLNKGFELGDRGYVNVTLEQRYHESTRRRLGRLTASERRRLTDRWRLVAPELGRGRSSELAA